MKIISKQKNSKMCYICGMENPTGLKAQFYNMEDGSVMTLFQYREDHQSFPFRVHGGLLAAMLDELGFRAYWTKDSEMMGVTISMETKFRKPAPYNCDLVGKGIIVKNTARFFAAEVSISDRDNNILTTGTVNYLKLPCEKVANANFHEEMCYLIPDELKEI